MADWKEMYLNLMKDTDKAIRSLEKSQEQCEQMYLNSEGLLLNSTQDDTPADEQREETKTNG